MEWLRYRTDLAYRLDKKIDKAMKEYVAETDWAHSYELEYDGEYGNNYHFTLVYYKEEQSEEVYSKWCKGLQNKLLDIVLTESGWKKSRLANLIIFEFVRSYIGENAEFAGMPRKIHFCNGGF